MSKPTLVEGDIKSIVNAVQMQAKAPIAHYEKELGAIRTGRASTKLIEGVHVESYGQQMLLRDLATLSTPDARMITVQPWDKSLLGAIEKALLQSDLGITPTNDGDIIRLPLPQMSSERRSELVKILSKKTEEARVNIRNIRKDLQGVIRDAEKAKTISEDFAKRLQDVLQKEVDATIRFVEELHKKKEADIMTV